MSAHMNRREFIRTAAAAGVSIPLLPAAASTIKASGAEDMEKSRVAEVSAPGVVKKGNRPDEPMLRKMVHQGVMKLTAKGDIASAWKCFINPDDVVGIKLNSWSNRLISSKKAIMEAVVEGARKVGVPANRIIVWDQLEDNLFVYVKRQKITVEEGGVQFRGCTPELTREHYGEKKKPKGFDTEPIELPWGTVRIAELVANELTAIINIPVLKNHTSAGISACLKNISHAVVEKPWRCHENFCNPYIADIVNIPCIKDKLRLHVLDGIFGVADGGPELKSLNHMFVNERLLISADPVAVETIAYDWIEDARKDKGFPPIAEMKNPLPDTGKKAVPAGHIATAASIGLGTNDKARIDLVKVGLI